MKIVAATVIVILGIAVLLVDTVPGAFTFDVSLLGFPIIGVGGWMLWRASESARQ